MEEDRRDNERVMIRKIYGTLEELEGGRGCVQLEHGLSYEVLLPAFAASRMSSQVGGPVTLHTVHFLEGSAQGSTFVPRLAGFLSEEDRAFYELFTSVKGIGPRKALRALALPTGQVAGAIAERDLKTIQSLPEIGKRMAETLVASLHGKVDPFVSSAVYGAGAGGNGETGGAPRERAAPARSGAREALEVLLQLGENRTQAVASIDEAMSKDPALSDPDEIVRQVLWLRRGG